MRSANALKVHRKSGEAERRDLRFRRPFLEMFFDRGIMGLRPTQGNEKRLGPASALYATVTLSLSSRPKRTRISCHAVPDKAACAPFS